MKKIIALFFAVLMFSTTALAATDESKSEVYGESGDYGCSVTIETCELSYMDKVVSYGIFTYKNMKYIPLRDTANFLGKEVSYDPVSSSINITDSMENVLYSASSADNAASGTVKAAYNDIYYNGADLMRLDNDFTDEAKKIGREYIPILNYNDRIYVPLKLLTESFGLLREYDGNKINISEPSDRLKIIPDAKAGYKDYIDYIDNDGVVDAKLINEAVQRQWGHYAEPAEVKEQWYMAGYYEGKLAIEVYTSLKGEYYLMSGVYEVI